MSNAIKYTIKGYIKVSAFRCLEGGYKIEITDTGVGIE
jgi:signal transduction histidine kinase